MTIQELVKDKSGLQLIISVFFAGSGMVMWLMSTVFSPQNSMAKDIAIIQTQISTIQLNHMKHLEDQGARIEEIEKKEFDLIQQNSELDKRLEKVLTIMEQHILYTK